MLRPVWLVGTAIHYRRLYLRHGWGSSAAGRAQIASTRARVVAADRPRNRAVLLAQNYHLIHHLWVSVPWFRYRSVFTHVEDGLRSKDATIEGYFEARG